MLIKDFEINMNALQNKDVNEVISTLNTSFFTREGFKVKLEQGYRFIGYPKVNIHTRYGWEKYLVLSVNDGFVDCVSLKDGDFQTRETIYLTHSEVKRIIKKHIKVSADKICKKYLE